MSKFQISALIPHVRDAIATAMPTFFALNFKIYPINLWTI